MNIKKVSVSDEMWDTVVRWHSYLDSDMDREIVISPFYGHYGLSGYIMTLQGSPTHGTVCVDLSRCSTLDGFITILPRTSIHNATRVWSTKYRYVRQSQKKADFFNDTFAILDWLGLKTTPGHADDTPVIYMIMGSVQKDLLDARMEYIKEKNKNANKNSDRENE